MDYHSLTIYVLGNAKCERERERERERLLIVENNNKNAIVKKICHQNS